MAGDHFLKRVVGYSAREAERMLLQKHFSMLEASGLECELWTTRNAKEEKIPEGTLFLSDDPIMLIELLEKNIPFAAWLRENQGILPEGIRYCFEEPSALTPEYLERVYRRFLGIPWEILETKRCILRETVPEDAESFIRMYAEPGMSRFTESIYPAPEEEKAYIRQYIRQVYTYFEFGVWTILDRETKEVIGRAGFSFREGHDLPELGYILERSRQHCGIALEVCREILSYGVKELEFEAVQVLIHKENEASLRLAKKLGFQYWKPEDECRDLYKAEFEKNAKK